MPDTDPPNPDPTPPQNTEDTSVNSLCPVCGGKLISEKCKVICRSDRCRYRIIFNCAEF